MAIAFLTAWVGIAGSSHFMRRDVAVPAHNAVRRSANNLAVLRFDFALRTTVVWLNEAASLMSFRFAADIAAAPFNCSDAARDHGHAKRLGEQRKLFSGHTKPIPSSFVSHVGYSLMIAAFSAEVVNWRLLFG